MNIYDYTFYRFYRLFGRVRSTPEGWAIDYLSITLLFNILSVLMFLRAHVETDIYVWFAVGLSVYILNTLYFNFKKRYAKIVFHYAENPGSKTADVLIFLYPVISFGIFLKSVDATNFTILFAVASLLFIVWFIKMV